MLYEKHPIIYWASYFITPYFLYYETYSSTSNLHISYKTVVHQDMSEGIVLFFPLVQLPPSSIPPSQCNFSLDSNNKNMHFLQGLHQLHQKVDSILSSFFSRSCSPLYSYTADKLQIFKKNHHLFQVISVGDWPKTNFPNLWNLSKNTWPPYILLRDNKNII